MERPEGAARSGELGEHEIFDLPNREAMSLIQPGLGLIEGNVVQPPQPAMPGADGAPSAPTDATPPTDGPSPRPMPPEPAPQPQPPVAETPPQPAPDTTQPYDPSVSSSNQT